MLGQRKAWRAYLQEGDGSAVCRNMEDNLDQLDHLVRTKQLSDTNFLEINYDEWMDNVWAGIFRIFSFLEIEMTADVVSRIQSHFSDDSSKRGYLSTYRGTSHDKDSWRTKLDNQTLELVESKCGNLLEDETTELEDSAT